MGWKTLAWRAQAKAEVAKMGPRSSTGVGGGIRGHLAGWQATQRGRAKLLCLHCLFPSLGMGKQKPHGRQQTIVSTEAQGWRSAEALLSNSCRQLNSMTSSAGEWVAVAPVHPSKGHLDRFEGRGQREGGAAAPPLLAAWSGRTRHSAQRLALQML